jgi:hypothetical protein
VPAEVAGADQRSRSFLDAPMPGIPSTIAMSLSPEATETTMRPSTGETPSESPAAGRIHRLRQAEVENLDSAGVGSLDVLWLEIAVDDPLLVRLLQRFRDLLGERQRLI